jgi:hypothetical protein
VAVQLLARVPGILRVREHHDGMAGGVEGAADGGGHLGADLEVRHERPFQPRHWTETVTLEDRWRSKRRRSFEAGEMIASPQANCEFS